MRFHWLLNTLFKRSCLPKARQFDRALKNIEVTQSKILLNMIKSNCGTEFGAKHKFASINSYQDFQNNVPLMSYEDYGPMIDNIMAGTQNVLTCQPIHMLEPTSGSTASTKYIPYTTTLKQEFQKGIMPWLYEMYSNYPKILSGTSYWSITPIYKPESEPSSQVPIGFGNDGSYFNRGQRYCIQKLSPVPFDVCRITDIESFRYITLLFLVKDKHLTFLSIWNPTFLNLLLEPLKYWMPQIIDDIEFGTITPPGQCDDQLMTMINSYHRKDIKRANELRVLNKHGIIYETIWPKLSYISCWADGHAKEYLKDIAKLFPKCQILPKGLIATECFVTFPLSQKGNQHILAINSHFYEFLEYPQGENIKLAHQLEAGKHYTIIVTTSGGLYRYKMDDIVEVIGFYKKAPLLKFLGRSEKVSDWFGEKLNEKHVDQILTHVFELHAIIPEFYMLSPERESDRVGYVLYLQCSQEHNTTDQADIQKCVIEIENQLCSNYHYRYCRELGQLAPLRLFLIDENKMPASATTVYLQACQGHGHKLGDIKPSVLNSHDGWAKKFKGSFVTH